MLLLAFASIGAIDPAHALTPSSTAVGSSQNPTSFGQAVTITATVTGGGATPTGAVALDYGDGTLGGGGLNGTGQFSAFHVYAAAGTYTVKATYIGDGTYSGSSGTLQQTLSKATTTTIVGALNNPAQSGGAAASFTASVSGTPVAVPNGTVIFDFGDGTTTPAPLAGGTATISHAYTTAGTFTVTATYSGDSNYIASSGATNQTVNKQPVNVVVNAGNGPVGSPLSIGVTVNAISIGTPTGSVTLTFGDGASATLPLSSGHASFTHTYVSAGTFTASATYNGDANYLGGIGSNAQTVIKILSSTALAVSPAPSTVGQTTTFTATVTSFGGSSVTPTGPVTFVFGDGNSAPGTLAVNGVATVTHTYAVAGGFSAQAIYNGDGNFIASTGNALAGVSPASTNTVLSATPNPSAAGQAVTLTATVTSTAGTPTGTVSFSLGDGTFVSGALVGNTATATHVYPAKGVFTVSATYAGDANFRPGTSNSIQQSVGGTSTTVTSAPNPSLAGQSVTVAATVVGPGGTPTGTMAFNFGDGTSVSAPLTAGGTASVNHVFAAGGNFTIQGNYSGDASFNASTGTTQQTVNLINTSTTLTSSLNPSQVGQAVTFTATASSGGGTPTGTVTFKDGTNVLGNATLASGIATFTTTALTQGSHTVTANYAGSGSQAASTSSPLIQIVNIPADSIKLRAMQVLAAPVAAQVSGQAISGAVDSAISEGFSDGGAFVTPGANGVRFNFAADPDGKPVDVANADPFGSRGFATPNGRGFAGQPARDGASSSGRVDDAFAALAYAGGPTKAPPRLVEPKLWLGWAEVRGSVLDHWNNNNVVLGAPANLAALYGNQVNALAGLTRRLTPNFLVGVLGGYETFDYRSDSLQGRLKGDGWTVGSYLGWRISQSVRFDAAAAYSGIGYDGTAGTATGSFGGHRLLLSSGLTGTYEKYGFRIEPSARVYALWEREDAYVDSLGTQQANRDFSTGRASAGVKVAYPLAWMTNAQIAPYAGVYGDYYFNTDSAGGPVTAPAVPSIYVLQGWSARAVGGVTARFADGAQISVGAERGGIGGDFALWTYRARASIPFGAR
jgi:hypothetical protein